MSDLARQHLDTVIEAGEVSWATGLAIRSLERELVESKRALAEVQNDLACEKRMSNHFSERVVAEQKYSQQVQDKLASLLPDTSPPYTVNQNGTITAHEPLIIETIGGGGRVPDTTPLKSVTITRADYAKACEEASKDQHRIGIFAATFFERVCFHLGLEVRNGKC